MLKILSAGRSRHVAKFSALEPQCRSGGCRARIRRSARMLVGKRCSRYSVGCCSPSDCKAHVVDATAHLLTLNFLPPKFVLDVWLVVGFKVPPKVLEVICTPDMAVEKKTESRRFRATSNPGWYHAYAPKHRRHRKLLPRTLSRLLYGHPCEGEVIAKLEWHTRRTLPNMHFLWCDTGCFSRRAFGTIAAVIGVRRTCDQKLSRLGGLRRGSGGVMGR